jgi:tetratricopeptide (TPR) repeat protein
LPRRDWYLAGAVAVFAFCVYALTVQPAVPLWDCGEFIACSVILGVPHPPGTPLFVLIGRLFSLLPTAADIGLRVNLVSVFFGAVAVGLAYLTAARIQRSWFFRDTRFWGSEWIIFMASFCGAVLFGFGNTVWTNSIEAEVYGITLFLFVLLIYLTIAWVDHARDPLGARLLLFAVFVAVLGLGVHMMVYLAIPALWLTVFSVEPSYRRDWRMWVSAAVTMLVMVTGIEAFLWNVSYWLGLCLWSFLAPVHYVRRLRVIAPLLWAPILFGLLQLVLPLTIFQNGWDPLDMAATIAILVVSLIGSALSDHTGSVPGVAHWRLSAGLAALALGAFSLQLYIPVRSAQNPRIDENNPETWTRFKGFVERKQYGRESMVERMFRRRGEWANQLGRHPRMGFWSFFEKQYGLKSGPVDPANPSVERFLPQAFFLLLSLGLLGIGYLSAVYWRIGLPLLLTVFLATVGLVVYMNFADGTHYNPRAVDQAYLEVRDRDYFFTTGFALFGLCVGLGVAAFLRIFLEPDRKMWRVVVAASSAVFLFAFPAKTLLANYEQNDRSRNFIAYDYAYNLLNSCDQNAVLFTNGDNDTFPVWCLQEAYRVRRDVRVINLSLANTDWYVHQIKDRIQAPFDATHDQISHMAYDPRLGRVQDQVIDIVLESNRWQAPVYFAVSVPEGNRVYRGKRLDSNLVTEGIAMRVVPEPVSDNINRELTLHRFRNVFMLRGVDDTTVHKDEAARRIADNYATSVMLVADSYRRAGQLDSALRAAGYASRLRPDLAAPRLYLAQLAGENGLKQVRDSLLQPLPPRDRAALLYNYGMGAEASGRRDDAVKAYVDALGYDSSDARSFRRLAARLYADRSYDTLLAVIERWVDANPGDTVGPKLKNEIVALIEDARRAQGAP